MVPNDSEQGPGQSSGEEPRAGAQLRVVTLNIWANRPPWPERGRLIHKNLRALSPDLVALQEVLRPQGHGTSQADEIAAGLGYRVAFSRACTIDKPFKSEFGNALLSRFPLREHRTEPLPVPEGVEPRSLLYALLSVRVGLLPVFVTHLTWEPEHQPVRAGQLRFIRDYIRHELSVLPSRVPDHVRILPPIFMGDLNAIPESDEVKQLSVSDAEQGQGLLDAWSERGDGVGYTFAASNPYTHKHGQGLNERIDYVFIGRSGAGGTDGQGGSGGMQIARAALCMDEPEGGVFPSDHYGVCVDLRLE